MVSSPEHPDVSALALCSSNEFSQFVCFVFFWSDALTALAFLWTDLFNPRGLVCAC